MPDGDAALGELTAFLSRFCRILNPLFDGIRKARDMERCLYEGRTFLWTFIVGHLVRLESRGAFVIRVQNAGIPAFTGLAEGLGPAAGRAVGRGGESSEFSTS